MTPVADGWHCAGCDRFVLDLRDLTRQEAIALMRERRDEHGQCIVVEADEWGRALFVGETLATLKRAAAGVAIAATLAGCGPDVAEAPPAAAASSSPPSAHATPTPAAPTPAPVPAPDEAAAAPLEAADAGPLPGEVDDEAAADAGPPAAASEPRRRRRRPPPNDDPLTGLEF